MLLGWHKYQMQALVVAFSMPVDPQTSDVMGDLDHAKIRGFAELLANKIPSKITPATFSSMYIFLYFLQKL